MKLPIPILLYHQISTSVHPMFMQFTVTTEAFETQMRIIKRLGFNPITLGNLVDSKKGLYPLPSKPIIITFDDVFEDAVQNAVPVLENSGYKAVFYAPTSYVGKTNSWMAAETGAEFKLANWDALKDIDAKGFEIGSHTSTHPNLTVLSPRDCQRELEESRKTLEEMLGHEVRHMAYPFGEFNDIVKAIAYESGYNTACAAHTRTARMSRDLFSLPRINVGMEDSMFEFILKLYTNFSSSEIMKNSIRTLSKSVPKPAKNLLKKLIGYQKSD